MPQKIHGHKNNFKDLIFDTTKCIYSCRQGIVSAEQIICPDRQLDWLDWLLFFTLKNERLFVNFKIKIIKISFFTCICSWRFWSSLCWVPWSLSDKVRMTRIKIEPSSSGEDEDEEDISNLESRNSSRISKSVTVSNPGTISFSSGYILNCWTSNNEPWIVRSRIVSERYRISTDP